MVDEWGSGRRGRKPPRDTSSATTSTEPSTTTSETQYTGHSDTTASNSVSKVETIPEQATAAAEEPPKTPSREQKPRTPMMQNGVPLTNWTDCGRYTLLGLATGAFVGVGAGAVDTFVKVRSRNLTRHGIVQLLTKTVASRGLACSGFFMTYQSILCLMRWKQLNQDSEVSNVLVSGAVAFSPFMVAGRGNTFGPYFMLLVAMDAFDQFRHQFER